ncbi:MAG: DUF4465 domain-containing protein [Bacteroidota bacterium]|nr:DUF4465 domain-containing protein [Bacteroidota bacterium]
MKKRIVSLMALLLSFVSINLFAQSLTSTAPNGTFTANDIEYWVGSGENEVGLIIYYNQASLGDDCFVIGYRCGNNVSLQDALQDIANNDSRFSVDITSGFLNDFAFDRDGDGLFEYSVNNAEVSGWMQFFMTKTDCEFNSGIGSHMEGNTWMSLEVGGMNDCLVQNATYTPVLVSGSTPEVNCDITSLPYTEGFDTYGVSGGGVYPFPTCWSKITSGNIPNISSTKHSGTGGLYMLAATNSQVAAVFPKLSDNISLNNLSLTFWGKVNTLGKRIVLGVMTDKDDISTFDTVWAETPTNQLWNEYTINFSQYQGSGKYIAFIAKGSSDAGNFYYIDDIELSETPTTYSMTDENIVAWVKGVEVTRGASITTGKYYDAIGQANTTNFVAIANGTATATFDRPIKNASGVDFVVFANEGGNQGQAFVEVSSDGENFFRFTNKTSVLPTGQGSAYDLEDLDDNSNLDKNNIRLIRLLDDGNGGFNLAGIGIYNAGEQYLIADFENMLSSSNTYEIVTNSTTGATYLGEDEWGMDMYSKDYTNGGLVFNGLSLYDGAFSIGWGPSNLTTASGFYASSAGAAIEGEGNGYLQGYFSDYAGTTEHLTVVTSSNQAFSPKGTYVCQSAASYTDAQTLSTNDGQAGWMKIVAKGYNQNGDSIASASIYLINNASGEVGNIKEWKWLDMSAFGEVAKVKFSMESNYANAYGLLISAYFCMDNFVYTLGEELPTPPATATLTETVCYGETFTFNGQTYNATGTYTTTVTGQNGDCDTNYTINLTVLPQNTATLTETVCYGETFTFNGQTYNATGTYTTTVTGQNGDCDTNYTINLTVREENTPINEEVTLSSSEFPYTYHGETYTAYGSYSVTEEDEYGCDQVYNLTLVANSGIAEIAEGLTISLYPNPTKANATLKVNGLNEQATIIITDQQGRVISSKVLPQGVDSMEVETDNLASGVYYIRVQTANTIRTEKLIKQA